MLSVNKSPNDKSCVTTLSDFRRIALSMPETEELNGMGYPSFRTGRKSFATIDDTMAVLRALWMKNNQKKIKFRR